MDVDHALRGDWLTDMNFRKIQTNWTQQINAMYIEDASNIVDM